MIIGVLALQGDFGLHQKIFREIGVESIEVRREEDLIRCEGLVVPGGESTTMIKLLHHNKLFQRLREFVAKDNHAIFGTCAGSIILSSEIINNSIQPLKLIDISIERNAYGRQRESFISNIKLNLNGTKRNFEGVFIRAPKIIRIGKGVRPLGYLGDNIVIAESENVLVSTFHPELADKEDVLIHRYFIDKVQSLKRK